MSLMIAAATPPTGSLPPTFGWRNAYRMCVRSVSIGVATANSNVSQMPVKRVAEKPMPASFVWMPPATSPRGVFISIGL